MQNLVYCNSEKLCVIKKLPDKLLIIIIIIIISMYVSFNIAFSSGDIAQRP